MLISLFRHYERWGSYICCFANRMVFFCVHYRANVCFVLDVFFSCVSPNMWTLNGIIYYNEFRKQISVIRSMIQDLFQNMCDCMWIKMIVLNALLRENRFYGQRHEMHRKESFLFLVISSMGIYVCMENKLVPTNSPSNSIVSGCIKIYLKRCCLLNIKDF